jgi:hypothetical protein
MVSTSGVNRHAGWFIDHNQVVVFVNDTDREGSHRGFMTMNGVRNLLAILDHGVSARRLAIDANEAVVERISLLFISRLAILRERARKLDLIHNTLLGDLEIRKRKCLPIFYPASAPCTTY